MFLEIFGSLLLILLSVWFYYYQFYKFYLKSIPGPRVWPIVGNILPFRDSQKAAMVTIPYFMKKYNTRTLRLHRPFSTNLVTKDYKLTEAILSSNTLIHKGSQYAFFQDWLGSGLFTAPKEEWRKQRKMITPTFHFHILEQFIDVFNANAVIMVGRLQRKIGEPSIDILNHLALCTLDSICETAMGTKVNAQLQESSSEYVKAVHTITNIVPQRIANPLTFIKTYYRFTSMYANEQKALKIVHGYTESVIKAKRQKLSEKGTNPQIIQQEDALGRKKRIPFLDMLFQATIDGKPLSDKQIRDEVSTFMFAGHDTTAVAMSYTLFALANNPEYQQKAFEELYDIYGDDMERMCTYQELQEMKYLDLVIKESLRIYPSAPLISRLITENFTLDGVTYPKGLTIVISPYLIQRDPEYFPDPEKFDPERFSQDNCTRTQPYSYIPFSAGARNCVGQKFANLEMKATLSMLLRHFVVKPATPEHKLQLISATVLKSLNGVKVSLEKRVY